MITEYTYQVTVEIKANTTQEQIELKKQFKRRMFETFDPDSNIHVSEVRQSD